VKATVAVWGEAPYEHYTFVSHVSADGGGGLEHRNSTVLGVDPGHLLADEKLQTRFLPLVAHEFFHAWNVKRILPAAFQPYPLQAETYTDLLWLFEGFTSYYELPILHRAGVVDQAAWAKMAAEDLEAYHKAIGRRRISVAQASRLTWTLLYQPHEHNVNRNVSYYTKGMWVGLCLDAELRRRKVKGGLDAVMRHLWRKHGRTGVGVTEDAFPGLVEQATGVNLRAKLAAWVDGTAELPLEAGFRALGWDLTSDYKDPKRKVGLGLEFKPGSAAIARLWEDRPAWKVLQPDDELVAALGYKWNADAFAERVAAKRPGDTVDLAVFREGRLRRLDVPLSANAKDAFKLQPRKGAAAARARTAWLGKPRPKPDAKGKGAAGGAQKPRGRHTRY
jgi:predicted metalloprotease with PDZ domain